MEVILKENFPSLGYVGDVVKVKSGYARNFLIPRGIASEASSNNARQLAHKMLGINARRAKLKGEAEELGKKLASVTLAYTLKAGEGGKIFGSVHAKDVEASLAAQGFEISKTQIKLSDSIKKAGDFSASIKLHSDVTVTLPIKVTSDVVKTKAPRGEPKEAKEGDEEIKVAAEGEEAPKPKKRAGKKKAAETKEGEATEVSSKE